MDATDGANALERGLHVLERHNDPELVEAYRRYMQRLEALVGRDHLDAYATVYQRERRQRNQQVVGTPLTQEEQSVREKVIADAEVNALYEQYLALAKAHGLLDPTFEENYEPPMP